MAEPLIRTKIINQNCVCFYVSPALSRKYVRQPLTLCYPEQIDLEKLPESIVDIPLITNIIPVIWLSGNQYTIEQMDEDLYYSLLKIKEFFKRFFYNTSWQGELVPQQLVKNRINQSDSNAAAALFTGGLDSTTTVLRHLDENITLISFNDPHKDAIAFAQLHQLNLHTIYMNHYDFLKLTLLDKISVDISKWFWDTSMGLSWIGAAAPLLYAQGISTLYIPSGFTWDSFIFPDGQTLRQPACPLIDENLSPAGLCVYHDLFTMTRPDKINFIASFCAEKNISKPRLVVCNRHKRVNTAYTHCNRCFKCYITMLDIIATGQRLQDYGFILSDSEFIAQFKSYMQTLKMRRGGTYVALRDTQKYIKQNIEKLPHIHREFYEWFSALDLWAMVDESSDRPPRAVPFSWDDYQDLYAR